MKKIFLMLSASVLLTIMAFPQEIAPAKVPGPVKQAFSKQFPAAKNISYEKLDQYYQAGFLQDGKQWFAIYDAAGKLQETQKTINPSALPKEITASVNKNFKGYTVVTAVKREASDKAVCYEMDLMKDQAGYQVRFSDKGEIMMKVPRKVELKVITK
ncbi:MAG: PepSY-like domain-containing protein [Bacteroidetes bacterium]|nr:PepSY-like domain-containing protein [Bacteroidota bacterium]